MRWQDREGSSNVEDRRGSGGGGAFGRGGGYGVRGGIPLRGKTGLIVIAIVIVAALYGYDLTPLLEGSGLPVQVQEQQRTDSGQARGSRSGQSGTGSPQDEMGRFISVMLKTTEEAWGGIFREAGKQYSPARLVLYTGQTSTACGYGQSAMGPFYCPADEKVYLDLSFYRDMQNHLGGGGDFALGYVLAHEVGHHVQNQLGITDRVSGLERGASKKEANRLSVMLELQADCFAGVWGRYTADQGMLENGDLQEAWTRPRPLATTGCSARARAVSFRTASLTAPQSSAIHGSAGGSTPGIRSSATRSPKCARLYPETTPGS